MTWIACLLDPRWRLEFKAARARRLGTLAAARIARQAREAAMALERNST